MSPPRGPEVDVVVPCYNGARHLRPTLDSALAQTHRPLRVLVVDDGSTDATRKVVEGYRGRVDYLFKENGGQASARNLGIARTRAEYVLLLDADDLVAPEMVSRLVGRLQDRPEADLAHSPPLAFFGDDSAHPGAEHWRPALAWGDYLAPLSVLCAIHGSATVLRRRAFERYGAFPESRAIQGCEDWHFWLQAVTRGAVVAYEPEPLCLYRRHPGGSSVSRLALARRESELMRQAVRLFDAAGIDAERDRAVLSVGVASVAGRWLALGDRSRFRDLMALATGIAPAGMVQSHLEPLHGLTAAGSAPLFQALLAGALVDLDRADLASVLFLRARAYGRLREEATSHGHLDTVERVVDAVDALVAAALAAREAGSPPSYATHLALARAGMERAAGRVAGARARLEQALALDPENVFAVLASADDDLRRGRWRAAARRARDLARHRRALVVREVLPWMLRRAVAGGAASNVPGG